MAKDWGGCQVWLIQTNTDSTVQQLTYNWNQLGAMSGMTMCCTLAQYVLYQQMPQHPLLIKGCWRKRLTWHKQHASWMDEGVLVWWAPPPLYTHHGWLCPYWVSTTWSSGSIKHGTSSAAWWRQREMFNWQELGPLVYIWKNVWLVPTIMNFLLTVHPTTLYFYLNGDGAFQDNNAPCHQAVLVHEMCEEHHSDFQHANWAPNFHNLDHIQHLWEIGKVHQEFEYTNHLQYLNCWPRYRQLSWTYLPHITDILLNQCHIGQLL